MSRSGAIRPLQEWPPTMTDNIALALLAVVLTVSCGTVVVSPVTTGAGGSDTTLTSSSSSSGCPFTLCDGACADTHSDSKNCGACGHDCAGGACIWGVCQAVALISDMTDAWSIAVDGTGIYYTRHYGPHGAVFELPIGGGAPTTLLGNQTDPGSLRLDATHAYFMTSDGLVQSLPLAGGSPTTLASGGAACSSDSCIAVDGTNLYWMSTSGTITRTPLAGGAGSDLVTGLSGLVALATDGASVYFGDADGIKRVATTGGAPTLISPQGMGTSGALALDATSVYWNTGNDIVKAPLGGGALTTLGSANGMTQAIAVDAEYVYWAADEGATNPVIMRAPVAGGAATTLAVVANGVYVRSIAVDSMSVYWTTASDVQRIAK